MKILVLCASSAFGSLRGRRVRPAALALGAVLTFGGCGRQPQAFQMPPAEVAAATLAPQTVTLKMELPGRTSAYRVAEVRARVDGIVLKRLFAEGSDVKEGQELYLIDPAPYQAAFDNAQGALARAEANAEAARLQARRYDALVKTNAVSKQDYDNAVDSLKADEADVAVAKAALETAAINLGYTKVLSPVSGRIGRSNVTEGAYVQQSQATLLATVQELDQMYVDLTESSTELLRLRKSQANIAGESADASQVHLILEDGSHYAESGTLQFADVTVDPATGSVILRALFPNPNRQLLPGMFVRSEVVESTRQDALLVPQSAVARDPHGDPTVYVVGANNKAELRTIRADEAVGNDWLVTSGLKAGERVVVDGLQRVRPGAALIVTTP